jgi:hypothetical protein
MRSAGRSRASLATFCDLSRTHNASPRPTRRISNETHRHTHHHVSALGEVRGQTKLVNITEDVRKYAAEQGVKEEDAVRRGLEEKATEFAYTGGDLYKKF